MDQCNHIIKKVHITPQTDVSASRIVSLRMLKYMILVINSSDVIYLWLGPNFYSSLAEAKPLNYILDLSWSFSTALTTFSDPDRHVKSYIEFTFLDRFCGPQESLRRRSNNGWVARSVTHASKWGEILKMARPTLESCQIQWDLFGKAASDSTGCYITIMPPSRN
jgi:hypothetical protein